jgi:hypothetical protein
MQTRETNFTKRRSVGSQFVGDENLGNEALTSKQFPEQPQRRGFIALGLDQDLENLAFAASTTGTKDARLQISQIGSALCFHPRGRLQHVQRATAFNQPAAP